MPPTHENFPVVEFKRWGAEVRCDIKQSGIVVASGIARDVPEAMYVAACQFTGKSSR